MPLSASLACSCLTTTVERSNDNKVRLARNLDWPGGDLLAQAGLVVVESGSGHRFASFTWPGLISVATGMNDAGLAVADLMALGTGTHRPQPGLPVLFALRSLLEKADSVESALAYLKSTQRTMAQNYAFADSGGARVVETGASYFYVRPIEMGLAAITNFWHEERGGAKDGRYARMLQTAGKEKLGTADLQRILAEAAIASMNVQSVILEPEARRAIIAQGKRPSPEAPGRFLNYQPGWASRQIDNFLAGAARAAAWSHSIIVLTGTYCQGLWAGATTEIQITFGCPKAGTVANRTLTPVRNTATMVGRLFGGEPQPRSNNATYSVGICTSWSAGDWSGGLRWWRRQLLFGTAALQPVGGRHV